MTKSFVVFAMFAGLVAMSFAKSQTSTSADQAKPPAEVQTAPVDAPATETDIPPAEKTPSDAAPNQAAPAAQPAQTSPATPAPATQTPATTPTQSTSSAPAQPSPAESETLAETKPGQRVQAAADVLKDIMSAPDKGIPEEVLGSAECVAVVPSLLKGGFVFGGRYGRGVASCRTPKGWSAPAFFTVKGGSFGLQIGGQAVDLVMLVMNEQGMRNLLSSKFQIGADASAAAGPVGRHAEGETDWKMRAQILTYSRARGVFAGLTLNGAAVTQDKQSTREFYGRMVPFRTSLMGQIQAPGTAFPFLDALSKLAKEAAAR